MKELSRVRQTYTCIKANRHQHGVQRMCEVLEVVPSGYDEWLKKTIYRDRATSLAAVAEYFDDFYNAVRRHSHLGGLSPERFEATHQRPRRAPH